MRQRIAFGSGHPRLPNGRFPVVRDCRRAQPHPHGRRPDRPRRGRLLGGMAGAPDRAGAAARSLTSTSTGVVDPFMADYVSCRDRVGRTTPASTPSSLDDRHAGRAGLVDAGDRPGDPRVEGPRALLRRPLRARAPPPRARSSCSPAPSQPWRRGRTSARPPRGRVRRRSSRRRSSTTAVAYIRCLANLRGRNADWAERAVRDSVSVPRRGGAQLGVIDLIASDRADLLTRVDGRSVEVAGGERVVPAHGRGRPCRPTRWAPVAFLLHSLVHPGLRVPVLLTRPRPDRRGAAASRRLGPGHPRRPAARVRARVVRHAAGAARRHRPARRLRGLVPAGAEASGGWASRHRRRRVPRRSAGCSCSTPPCRTSRCRPGWWRSWAPSPCLFFGVVVRASAEGPAALRRRPGSSASWARTGVVVRELDPAGSSASGPRSGAR